MKNIFILATFLFVSTIIVTMRYFVSPLSQGVERQEERMVEKKVLPIGYEIAVWDWRGIAREDVPTFISEIKARGANTIYLNIAEYVDIYENEDPKEKARLTQDFFSNVRKYLAIAKDNGVQVQALAGNVDWGNSSHRYLNKIVIDFVKNFNEENKEIAFSGIQFDIEPYSQQGFSASNQEVVFVEYLDTVEGIVNIFETYQERYPEFSAIKLGFVIPYWYDGESEYSKKITWEGEDKFLFYHILNRINRLQTGYLVIMAYRNFAEGSGGVIEHSLDEIRFASQNTPRVGIVIAQETSNVEPSRITFYGKSFNEMVDEVGKIGMRYESFENMKGFAFNNSDSFLGLKW